VTSPVAIPRVLQPVCNFPIFLVSLMARSLRSPGVADVDWAPKRRSRQKPSRIARPRLMIRADPRWPTRWKTMRSYYSGQHRGAIRRSFELIDRGTSPLRSSGGQMSYEVAMKSPRKNCLVVVDLKWPEADKDAGSRRCSFAAHFALPRTGTILACCAAKLVCIRILFRRHHCAERHFEAVKTSIDAGLSTRRCASRANFCPRPEIFGCRRPTRSIETARSRESVITDATF